MSYFNTILANISQVAETGSVIMTAIVILAILGWGLCIHEVGKNSFVKPLKYCSVTLLVLVTIYVLTNGAHI